MLACSCCCDNIILEFDNLELIHACRSGIFLSDEAVIINDILELKKSFLTCALVWAPREANQPADLAAKKLLVGSLPVDWVTCKP